MSDQRRSVTYFILIIDFLFPSVWLNKTKVHNRDVLIQAIKTRPKGTPIITISNHESCFDDPGLWGEEIKLLTTIIQLFIDKQN